MDKPLSESQLQHLAEALHLGSQLASRAMATWLSIPSVLEFDSVDQLPITDAADVLGDPDQTLCFCSMEITGSLTGQIILAFDDSSGLSLADLILDHPVGMATDWGEVETSAALETANIIGCAYLNALAKDLTKRSGDTLNLLPSPPAFRRILIFSSPSWTSSSTRAATRAPTASTACTPRCDDGVESTTFSNLSPSTQDVAESAGETVTWHNCTVVISNVP